MNPVIDKILSQVYELEGLLMVVERLKGDATPFLYEMIQKKVDRINELVADCVPGIYESQGMKSQSQQPAEPAEEEETEATEDAEESAAEEHETAVMEETFAPEPEETVYVDYEAGDDTGDDSQADEFVDMEPEYMDYAEDVEAKNAEEYIEAEVIDVVPEDNGEETDFHEPVEEDEPDGYADYEAAEAAEEELKLDEKLQRNLSKDLSRAFSLNDRFRYRRELFGNSEVEMCNTLNMVEAMHSFSEAEDYFYGDLEWDKDSPEVADFMTIIRNHFL